MSPASKTERPDFEEPYFRFCLFADMTLKLGHCTKFNVLFPVVSRDLSFLTNYLKLINKNHRVVYYVCAECNKGKLKAATEASKREKSREIDNEMRLHAKTKRIYFIYL